ncbi:bacterio-opsin activator [Halobiforma lacisalsi AJ5]|uniref:Bacterio-opsin activator n=1 Tax=Natronobacterium lacisalsi AJ5 TaxID=358396 RepID=M0LG89_NATLA|nr:helix-turn-helix domain-containing protein [Halobiforma lacisalsi]APW98675.1 bacterio-opsin activator [Halobiforma lacisalsi AJ5]EMA32546.1 DNA binding protein [Halobiforma lacisalsi AJ5]
MALQEPDRESESASAPDPSSYVRAQFRIEPHPDAYCSVLDAGEREAEIDQDLLCRDGDCGDGCECRSEVSDPSNGGSQYIRTAVTDRCICPVFRRHDCITSIEGIERGSLRVSLTTPDRTELERIVDDLRETGATVQLERITSSGPDVDGRTAPDPDADGLTEKQREAVVVAVESGYYETPRRADLADLADELGVSRSAVSQRLNAVESKLVNSLVRG